MGVCRRTYSCADDRLNTLLEFADADELYEELARAGVGIVVVAAAAAGTVVGVAPMVKSKLPQREVPCAAVVAARYLPQRLSQLMTDRPPFQASVVVAAVAGRQTEQEASG